MKLPTSFKIEPIFPLPFHAWACPVREGNVQRLLLFGAPPSPQLVNHCHVWPLQSQIRTKEDERSLEKCLLYCHCPRDLSTFQPCQMLKGDFFYRHLCEFLEFLLSGVLFLTILWIGVTGIFSFFKLQQIAIFPCVKF